MPSVRRRGGNTGAMPVWAKIIFAVLVVALGSVIGVWLHNTLDGQDQVQTVAAVKKPASPAPVPIRETKTAVPDLPPASAGFNHPRPHRQSSGDKGAAASSFASLQQSIGGEVGNHGRLVEITFGFVSRPLATHYDFGA